MEGRKGKEREEKRERRKCIFYRRAFKCRLYEVKISRQLNGFKTPTLRKRNYVGLISVGSKKSSVCRTA